MVGESPVEVREEPTSSLSVYADVTIAFVVGSVLTVTESGSGFDLAERRLEKPWVKNYDAMPNEHPSRWPTRWDVTNWTVFAAYRDGRRVGGAVVAADTPGVDLLEGRKDLAVLWDIRVTPTERGRGVGRALFLAATAWATAGGRREMKIETQDVNVAACRFYERMGCRLGAVHRGVYPDFPTEAQLIWRLDLA